MGDKSNTPQRRCPRHGRKHIRTEKGIGMAVDKCQRCGWKCEYLTEIFKSAPDEDEYNDLHMGSV